MVIKTIKYMVLAAVALVCTTSCEKELEPYSHPDCYVNFSFYDYYNEAATTEDMTDEIADAPVIFNFKFKGDATQDTVWVDGHIIGFLKDYDRTYAIEQVVVDGEDNAVAGEDYVPFDDASLQSHMVVKAGENTFSVPVVVNRTAKLKTKNLTLKIRFKANENFKNGYEVMQTRVISFTDRLAKPSVWDSYYLDYIYGDYSEAKHTLMIEWTGKAWDDDYITEMYTTDSSYLEYLQQVLAKRLAEENAKRVAAGLDIYREADGSALNFDPKSWW